MVGGKTIPSLMRREKQPHGNTHFSDQVSMRGNELPSLVDRPLSTLACHVLKMALLLRRVALTLEWTRRRVQDLM